MDSPIADFVKSYAASGTARFHMPGHKGRGPLGCEPLDITEIAGADSLYEASGIIAQSEENARCLFGTGRTLYSTEGSSQCIRAMLQLILQNRRPGTAPVILAARNVHKAFIYAAALLDFQPEWLWPEGDSDSLLDCPISPRGVAKAMDSLPEPPAAVYITSPDYLGNLADVKAVADVVHERGSILAVDNAHGAYLHFLESSLHPMDLGADICCDSAHKTLPVLTGGAYLHISKSAPESFRENARQAMALFGSTSPSYLTMASLDMCNVYLAGKFRQELAETCLRIEDLKARLKGRGWGVETSDPLRLCLRAPEGGSGLELAQRLREKGMECEHADGGYLVLMFTPENSPEELERLEKALGYAPAPPAVRKPMPLPRGERAMSLRRAMLSTQETVPAGEALGRICGAPTVACPPAVPIAVSGERIGREALELFRRYGLESVDVVI